MTTTSSGGRFVREWLPDRSPRGGFLLLHGMESHSGWFSELASRLAGEGWAVLAGDRPGWGRSGGPRGALASYRDFVDETSELAASARSRFGPLHLAGMSWGGMAALYLGLRRGWLFDSIALLAPGLCSKLDLGTGDRLRVGLEFLRPDPSRTVAPRFRPEHFTTDPKWRHFIDRDPERLRRVGASFCLETVKMRRFIQETAGRRRLPPALCLLAGDDAIVDNRRTGELCRRAGIEVETFAGAAHSLVFERPTETAARLSRHAAEAGEKRRRNRRRVWVVGGGAVGGSMASLLSFAGHEVGLLVKPTQVDWLRKKGFVLRSGGAPRRTGRELTVAARPEELPPDPDLAVLAVKSFDTASVLAGLAGRIPERTVLASLQNGIANEDAVAAAFPRHGVAASVICASLELEERGEARWADDRGGLGGACFQGDCEKVRKVWSDIFSSTGMECLWVEGERASQCLKWSKLMLNIGFNALNSVTGKSSAELLADPRTGRLAVRAMREGFAAMRALSLEPVDLPGFPVSKLHFVTVLPFDWGRRLLAWRAGRTAEAAFSMRQDVLRKRQHTEIDELNGAVVAVCREVGLPVGANAKLAEMVQNFLKST